MSYQLELQNVFKLFGSIKAVDDVSLHIDHGEFLTLLGPSGSGKTTTLNMIAGFEIPTSGDILLENEDITTVAPNRRGIGMVFQNYALFPHMTVYENIAFPLKMRKITSDKIRTMTDEALELVKLPGFETRYPNQLSGGQQQRIALARALVFQPKILLMDEPLGALDKKLRDHMRLEIKHLQESLNITVIYVTHDQEEALTMSDRIAIMNDGRIVQLDKPVELYESPANLFVADFIGESNFLQGRVAETNGDSAAIETKEGLQVWVHRPARMESGEEFSVAVRPEKIQVLAGEQDGPHEIVNRFTGRVEEIVYLGEAKIYRVGLAPDVIIEAKVQSGPFAVLPISATLRGFDRSLEHAALNLGASRFQTFMKITFPIIRPGILTGAIFAFMIAFDEVVIALFLCGSTAVTLPKKMWDVIRYEIEPMLPAISTLLLLLAALILVLIGILQKRMASRMTAK